MSQIIEYFRSLFNTNNSHNRKRRRVDLFSEEREPLPKYKKVNNIFPKTYNTASLDDDADLFQEVKQKKPLYNELLENFFMDQQKKHLKAVLDDGEFSDEEEDTLRMPASSFSKRNNIGFNFHGYHQDSHPSTSTSSNFTSSRIARLQQLTNGASRLKESMRSDDNVQFNSLTRKPMAQRTRQELPSLIPISRVVQSSSSSSLMSNGHSSDLSSSRPITIQPARGRRSILDFTKKNRAFNDPPKVPNSNSILYRTHNMAIKNQYDDLLKSLIPSYSNAALVKRSSNLSTSKPVDTIDLCDDTENVPANNLEVPQQPSSSSFLNASYTGRKSDFHFKKPTAYIELDDDDDEVDQSQFFRSPGLSSTQIVKSKDLERSSATITNDKKKQLLYRDLPPVNSLKERHSTKSSLQDGHLEKLLSRYSQKQTEKDKSIAEEEKNVLELEEERIKHERVQQKRIDDQITSALSEKCIIIDEEEDVVDEFPPLTPEQNRIIQFALHGSRNDIIISKFNMNITRHDFATLDGLNWLNDEVINFYMELIKERSERLTHLPKVHVMNTFFLGKLLQSGHSGVRRWTRKVDIFSFDIIPIPVHVGGVHWCMSIINMRDKTIRYYDSMGHPNHHVLEALEQYLKDESLDKRKIPFDTSDWTMECVLDCPQQKNGSDCGVFSCQFAEFISRDSPISFEQQHMPYIRRKMIYEIATGKLLLG